MEVFWYGLSTFSTVISIIVTVFLLYALCYTTDSTESYTTHKCWQDALVVNDTPYTWTFEEAQDLQTPELPTGCEATAAATLVRLNGFITTKKDIADAMPKNIDGHDFVHEFWGDPYSPTGWSCMAPCIVDTINSLGELNGYAAFDITGTNLDGLVLPCEVWVTMYLDEPKWSGYSQDGYRLAWNPHAVVITEITLDTVECVDPLVGVVSYSKETFEKVYNEMGQQAVIVKEWQ